MMEDRFAGQLVERISAFGFAATVERLERAIADAGLEIFARIDHAAAAREAGLQMPPTLVLIYGHPKGGTPIMLEHADAALELPLKLLVREKPESSSVLFRPIALALASAGVPAEQAGRLAAAQLYIAAAIAAP